MLREDKERIVADLVERLRTADTLIVADYRGLTMTDVDGIRSELLQHGARFAVVKNTLTRRAAEAGGGPLTTIVGIFAAPLREVVGVMDARIRQLEEQEA